MKDYTEDYAAVAGIIPLRERLTQLAEECNELAQAALKVVRTLPSSMNPTPVSCEEAQAKMNEEFGDVLMCADLCGLTNPGQPMSMSNPKWERWRKRVVDKYTAHAGQSGSLGEEMNRSVATCPRDGWPD